ncbi:ribosome maturation factor [Coxiella burnetii]|uniref:Ribosome maturation factor RimP n=1 Tax=Coxiella burnetii (strain Dugway 5J108-111) TaxID=434922 RepID=RIMP_COXBN|nr:ribosome maturation factor RimP [Coxiella burnetii]A9KBL9.1 RecName: Full=Ribosome maturation factor RimP [Coxiella burnetii Dugway 5J108-111]ABS77646.1 hypothetical cytosolic protein [Coxiella burnetii Dugway 5J108-111]OYK80726.1 ribosome maturation factor [Coxiella burnetii]OYK82814.1 ribosome maturation factor [Coxiella burnetii]
MSQARTLHRLIAPAVEALGFELVGCELFRRGATRILQVFVDKPGGIGLDECAKVSRQISAVLDVEDPIRGRYTLEVSSPGLERPLYTANHYRRFIGNKAKIRLREPREGQRQFRGMIVAVDNEEQVTLQLDNKILKVPLGEIEKANLIADFEG